MKKIAVVLGILLLLTSFGWAQKSKISIVLDGIGCSTTAGPNTFPAKAWSFGASNPVPVSTGGGGGVGKPTIQDLNVTRTFDACSPALFKGVVNGKHFKTLTLTQNEKGKDADYLVVTLSEVLISSYSIGGSTADEDPDESVSFNFTKICIFESSSGMTACFDQKAGTAN